MNEPGELILCWPVTCPLCEKYAELVTFGESKLAIICINDDCKAKYTGPLEPHTR
jgi:hypothetical protein